MNELTKNKFPESDIAYSADENSSARAAWRFFTNKVYLSPEHEELSYVQYAIARWTDENK